MNLAHQTAEKHETIGVKKVIVVSSICADVTSASLLLVYQNCLQTQQPKLNVAKKAATKRMTSLPDDNKVEDEHCSVGEETEDEKEEEEVEDEDDEEVEEEEVGEEDDENDDEAEDDKRSVKAVAIVFLF